jgi:hypothetical protein
VEPAAPSDPSDPVSSAGGADEDLAPRPRAGFRSRPAPTVGAQEMAAVFAGVLRAVIGLVCFFAALLYLPSTPATPVLTGVSLVLVVTGNLSVFRAARGLAQLKILPRALAAGSGVVVVVCVALTAVLGAGAFRPVPPPHEAPPTVRFDSTH